MAKKKNAALVIIAPDKIKDNPIDNGERLKYEDIKVRINEIY